MDSLSIKRFEMLKRVKDFGTAHASAFADGSLGKELFETVAQIVNEVESQGATHLSGLGAAQPSTASKSATREDLREMLQAINRTARVLAFDTPGLDNKFRFPRGLNDQTLLTAARAFAADATPLKDQFVRHEMTADFIEKLNQTINAFEQATTQKNTAVGLHRTTKMALDDNLGRGSQAVRQLDVVIRNKFNGDPVTLAEWTRASHVAKRTRNAEAEPDAPAPQAGQPATPSA
jgi:hypothetical protein